MTQKQQDQFKSALKQAQESILILQHLDNDVENNYLDEEELMEIEEMLARMQERYELENKTDF